MRKPKGPRPAAIPTRRRTALLLFLMAASLLIIGYRLEDGDDPRPGGPPALLESRDPAADAGGRPRLPDPGSSAPPGDAALPDPPAADPAADLGRPVRWLSGRVLDAGGRPIPGVEVALGEQRAATDAAGEFLLLQGSDVLRLRHPDFFPRDLDPSARRFLALSSGDPAQSRLLLAMFPGGRIRGRVTSAGGRPIEGVEVHFVDPSARVPPPSDAPAVTAADGSYASPLLRPGPHRLLFRHPGYQVAEAAIALPAGELEARGDAALHPGDPLLVHAAAAGGDGLPDAGIWLLPPAGSGASPLYLGVTGDRGFLEARRDPRLHRRVRAVHAGYREIEAPIDGGRVELRLEPAPALAGTAVERRTGLPVDIAAVRLEIETPEGFQPCLDGGVLFRPLERGKFLAGLPPLPGTYRASIRAQGDLVGISDPILFDGESAPPSCTVRLDRRGTLEGVVLDDDLPLEGALVELYLDASLPIEIPAEEEEEEARLMFAGGIQFAAGAGPIRSQVTGPGGRFRFGDLPAEAYRLRAAHPRLAELYSPPIAIPTPGPMPLSMSRGGALHGVVRGPTGEPEAGIPLILLREGFPFPRLSASDASGRYEFRNLFPGIYHLIVGDPAAAAEEAVAAWTPRPPGSGPRGPAQGSMRITAGAEETLDVRLVDLSWGWIHGRITADGEPLAGAVLSVLGPLATAGAPPGGDPSAAPAGAPAGDGEPAERRAVADAGGSFRVLGLAPGAYRVRSEVLPIDRLLAVEGGRKTLCHADLRTFPFAARLHRRRAGTPVPAAAAEIRLESSGRLVHQGAFLEGALPAVRLFPGVYRLDVHAAGFLPRRERFAVEDREVSLSLEMIPAIRIRIERPQGLEDGPEAARLPRGLTEVVLLRSGVEVYRASELVEDEVLIPEVEPGIYELVLRNSRGAFHSRFEVLESRPGSP